MLPTSLSPGWRIAMTMTMTNVTSDTIICSWFDMNLYCRPGHACGRMLVYDAVIPAIRPA